MNCVKCNGETVPMYPISKVRCEYVCGNCIDGSVLTDGDKYEQMIREHDAARRPSRIYVASSWRNSLQPAIVHILRRLGHDVYDFRNPPGNTGFSWGEIDPDWQSWTPAQWREAMRHPIAERGYESDITALRACDEVVFVLPCGRSASWESGYAMGQGKRGYVVALDKTEPELMFREATIITSMSELFDVFERPATMSAAVPLSTATRTCDTCLHCRFDAISEDKFCYAPEVRKRAPFGVSFGAVGVPTECLINGVRTLWEQSTRGGQP